MTPEKYELAPRRREKYVAGRGSDGAAPVSRRSRCPTCGTWRRSAFVCEPCPECVEMTRSEG